MNCLEGNSQIENNKGSVLRKKLRYKTRYTSLRA
jgi:hypothetical protein